MPLDSEGYRFEEWSFPFPLFVNDSAICVISRPNNTVAMCTASILQCGHSSHSRNIKRATTPGQ
ncbi:predicted protein [Aspergillus nidulans FGSC A4]|uniref:Uncharacterized protein n=1 Tax=Emericella nidulans (strain FGSC A4 / ATCC 38163 / CBS 112.46 / NRRL 194 / M139) TaxID=227321 RepID=Q5BHD9_EMENI|nr:hypothetical protein [Aspergillus nidulans FGSC A4]EAA65360.1 predicted protein [Aspergillus nidulans FGSC A4]CBF90319.1 TPA: conserved hypothetical protein [Aspergillus nidulans FGSC A4]|eukprot:XP_657645.1 predicted protein [Aspergillus nidulans FGSC A4]